MSFFIYCQNKSADYLSVLTYMVGDAVINASFYGAPGNDLSVFFKEMAVYRTYINFSV